MTKNNEAINLELIELVNSTGLSTKEFGQLIKVKENTLLTWIRKYGNPPRCRTPSLYILEYVRMKVKEYKRDNYRNATYIRYGMDIDQLIDLLNDIRDDALKTKGDRTKINADYSDFEIFLNDKNIIPKGFLTPIELSTTTADKQQLTNEEITKEIKHLFDLTKLSNPEISKLLQIGSNTLDNWIYKGIAPPIYVFEYVKMKVKEHLISPEINIEAIQNEFTDDELISLFKDIQEDALNACGKLNNLKPEYKNFYDLLTDITLIKLD